MTEKAKIDTETICKQTSSNRENKKCPIQTKISKTARGGPTKKLGVRSLNTIKISTKCPPPRCVYAERDFRHMSIMMVSIGQGNWHLRYRRPAGSIWTPTEWFFSLFHYVIFFFIFYWEIMKCFCGLKVFSILQAADQYLPKVGYYSTHNIRGRHFVS